MNGEWRMAKQTFSSFAIRSLAIPMEITMTYEEWEKLSIHES